MVIIIILPLRFQTHTDRQTKGKGLLCVWCGMIFIIKNKSFNSFFSLYLSSALFFKQSRILLYASSSSTTTETKLYRKMGRIY